MNTCIYIYREREICHIGNEDARTNQPPLVVQDRFPQNRCFPYEDTSYKNEFMCYIC